MSEVPSSLALAPSSSLIVARMPYHEDLIRIAVHYNAGGIPALLFSTVSVTFWQVASKVN